MKFQIMKTVKKKISEKWNFCVFGKKSKKAYFGPELLIFGHLKKKFFSYDSDKTNCQKIAK